MATPAPTTTTDKAAEQILGEQLVIPATRQSAFTTIETVARDTPEKLYGTLWRFWIAPMQKAGMHEDVLRLTTLALVQSPFDRVEVEMLLRARIDSAMALQNPDLALQEAKRFYNVCRLDQTGGAVDLIAKALGPQLASDEEPLLRRWRMRQMTVARATSQPTTAPADPIDEKLKAIVLDDTPFKAGLDKWTSDRSSRRRAALGNLLLIAGRKVEALEHFDRSVAESRSTNELAAALERQGVARRAVDGDAGRAQTSLRELQELAP